MKEITFQKLTIMKKLVLSVVAGLVAFTGFGQIWNQVGSGLAHNTNGYPLPFELGSSIAVTYGHNVSGSNNYEVHTDVWNGVSWSSYPTHTLSSGWGYVSGAGAINNTPYFASGGNVYYYNGSAWAALTLPSTTSWISMIPVDNKLLIQGNFANGDWGYLYDGNNFSVLPTPSTATTGVGHAMMFNNELYIVGSLDSNAITGPLDVLKLVGSAWVNPVNWIGNGTLGPWQNGTKKLLEYNNELYVIGDQHIFELSNDTAIIKETYSFGSTDAVVYNGDIYISNGGTAGTLAMAKYDGTALSNISLAPRALNFQVYQGELYAFSYFQSYNNVNYNYAYRTQAGFSFVNGQIFNDLDSDCALDGNEGGVPGMAVEFSSGDIATTNQAGMYSVNLVPGTYTIDAIYPVDLLSSNMGVNCSLPITVTVGANATVTQDVGAELAAVEDVAVHIISPWRARFGFDETYTVVVSNLGQPTAAGTLELDIPASVNLVSTNPTAIQTGNTLSWSVGPLASFEQLYYGVTLEIDTNTNTIGDTLDLTARLVGYANDVDLTNNEDPIFQEVRGAYDPNDKQVNIEFAEPGNLTLDYVIRFQNTGNDTAYKVTIVDSLSTKLDPTTFMMLGATHNYEVTLKNNVARFVFDNILLPDSSVSQEKSQGKLRFRINSAAALADGESVSNDAYIYFDFQQPIHTNYAITQVEASIGLVEQRLEKLTLEVYPNPAKDYVHLKSTSNQREEVRLTDASGRVIKQMSLPAKGETQLDLRNLKTGMYFVLTSTETYKILIAR
jgi:uncharacterized repeat protein (TIGR01451 family)